MVHAKLPHEGERAPTLERQNGNLDMQIRRIEPRERGLGPIEVQARSPHPQSTAVEYSIAQPLLAKREPTASHHSIPCVHPFPWAESHSFFHSSSYFVSNAERLSTSLFCRLSGNAEGRGSARWKVKPCEKRVSDSHANLWILRRVVC